VSKEVVLMKLIKVLLIILATLFLASCAASSRVGPEYEAGRLYSREIAKKDAFEFNCLSYPRKVYPGMNAIKYTDTLKSQGKTENFIEGFYLGYKRYYLDYIKVYCR
jgi:hypothetical protein